METRSICMKEVASMTGRLRGLGIVLGLIGIAFVAAGAFAFMKTQEGYRSLNAFSAAQDVQLTYNDKGQLANPAGDTEEAQAIMALLTKDWGYPVATSELDPKDPIVNTASEYMYQMATVTYHTLHGTQTVVLTEPADAPDALEDGHGAARRAERGRVERHSEQHALPRKHETAGGDEPRIGNRVQNPGAL